MKKSFMELALQIETIQEDQQGKLQGGFTTFSMAFEESFGDPTNNCTNNCTCTNSVAGCGAKPSN